MFPPKRETVPQLHDVTTEETVLSQLHVGLWFIYANIEGREHDKCRDLPEGLRKMCVRGVVE
jgi:hypothetical protein